MTISRMRKSIGNVLVLLACVFASNVASSRTLSWDSLDVDAHLDKDGLLYVTELHAIRFDGDWNGGERRFRVERHQQFKFISLTELDSESGVKRPFESGNLNFVGEYKMFPENVLRWRSRLPQDPPFKHESRWYEIKYTLANIVIRDGGAYRLDHDLAFPNRPGVIERFTSHITLDPLWQVDADVQLTVERTSLIPNQSVIIKFPLHHVGSTSPRLIADTEATAQVEPPANMFEVLNISANWVTPILPWRFALLLMIVALLGFTFMRWHREELAIGKLFPLESVDSVDAIWLATNIFVHPPEIVGAMWDDKKDACEVAAALARLTLERKLRSEVRSRGRWFWRRDVLHLKLLVARTELKSYERELIDLLFFDAAIETDTDRVRQHYRGRNFDPSKVIPSTIGIQRRQSRRAKGGKKNRKINPLVALSMVALALAIAGVAENPLSILPMLVFAFWMLLPFVGARVAAGRYRARLSVLNPPLLLFCLSVLVIVALVVLILFKPHFGFAVLQSAACTVFATLLLYNAIDALRPVENFELTQKRLRFSLARDFFLRELRSESPALRDEWYPYLLAFGLGRNVDRWFKRKNVFAVRSSGAYSISSSSTKSDAISNQVTEPNIWTGGGGAFGGGGASGSWSAAASGIAASIAVSNFKITNGSSGSRSSGGGSSGGGSSGTSSGGGGGGGW